MRRLLLTMATLVLVLTTAIAGTGLASADNGGGNSALFAGTSWPAKVYMYTGNGTEWIDISGDSFLVEDAVLDLVVYDGQLYASTMDCGGRVWRYDGGQNWTLVGDVMDDQANSLAVYNGILYAGTSWNGMRLYRYNAPLNWTMVADYSEDFYLGTRALYEYNELLLMGDHGMDNFGHIDAAETFTADLAGDGSCIYDYQAFGDYVYASAWLGRLWNSPDGTNWTLEQGYGSAHMWELEEFQGDLYMAYDDGVLEILGGTGPVLTAGDGITSMTTDGALLYYGIGGEAAYNLDHSGTGYVYCYDGAAATLISEEMGEGVQVLYVGQMGTPSKVTGGGSVDWGGGRVTYGFTAQLDASGAVKGEAQFQHRDTGVRRHADVLYLAVSDGDAWIGAVITQSDDPGDVGQEIYFRVQDNGQGKKATGPDQVSTVASGPAVTAVSMPDLGLIPWTNGNVQVR